MAIPSATSIPSPIFYIFRPLRTHSSTHTPAARSQPPARPPGRPSDRRRRPRPHLLPPPTPPSPAHMCHRQLRFLQNTACHHLRLLSDANVDCQDPACRLSARHPHDCGIDSKHPCRCRRYYTQPERLTVGETTETCRMTH
ncbi:hypothetical protein FA95DRAFT_1600563 [Auriscalpium vulgare]|uniref:Uncharacterized protein n=1 Tax=Auriscalpium vulgare TaxID=40419 RepID=A0ACB8SBT7_9AGAM|nr:hypothetical protein FA95DRAFT_1600563 [Auriscalpium vulgare]